MVCGENPDDLATRSNFGAEIDPSSKIIPMLEHICPLFLKMHKRAEDSFPGGLFPGREKAGLGGWVSVV